MSYIRNFIWSGDPDHRKLVTVSWKKVSSPKQEGGLGLRHLASLTLNQAALLNSGWRAFADSAWGIFLRNQYKFSSCSASTSYHS